MSRRDSCPPTSPLIPIDPEQNIATISRHDSITSPRDAEIAALKRQIEQLQLTEASLRQQGDQASRELKACKSELAKEKREALTFAGRLSKESRNFTALTKDMAALREDTARKVCDIESKLDQEKRKRIKTQQDANKTITDLRSELDAKQSAVKDSEARVPAEKRHLYGAQAKMGVTRAATHRPTSSLTRKPDTHEPNSNQSSTLSSLHNIIKDLQKENTRLQDIQQEDGCGEYRTLIFQQLEDARRLQAAAEAETEGLRHLAKANAELMDDNATHVEAIKALIQQTDSYGVKVKQLRGISEEPLVKEHVTSSLTNKTDVGNHPIQPLGISVVTCVDTVPVIPDDDNNKAEIADYTQRLRAAELEIQVLSSENEAFSKLRALEHQPSAVLELSSVLCLALEPQSASSSKSALEFSGLQTVSTTPRTPLPAGTPLDDPMLLAGLEDLGKSITSLSTVPCLNAVVNPSTKLPVKRLPNAAITINIQPTDKRNYSLLRRIKRAISATSSLHISGPKELVKQLLASMHEVEADHTEKCKLVVQLEKVAKQHREDIEVLKAQLQDRRRCLDPKHRMLADELEAKNVQFAMQEQLLASWGRLSE
ncbi:hypothetical protein ACET3X_002843 [Alternaria dauci]|uniref:Uncharacterized protein n=1 Tax=Alternaria dauci TaxID=48095 RepID=A0ABR3UQS9_9PLEO